MQIQTPTISKFKYNRQYPPLFFAVPNEEESQCWVNSMEKVSREFFTQMRSRNNTPQTLLSNGMSCGEYSMWVLLTNHIKRTSFYVKEQ